MAKGAKFAALSKLVDQRPTQGVKMGTGRRSAWLCFAVLLVMVAASFEAAGHGFDGHQARELALAGPLVYVRAGAIHMLTGYDPLLFLFGRMFFLTSFREIVVAITAFTIGHSITLIFATARLNHSALLPMRLMPLSHPNASMFAYRLPE